MASDLTRRSFLRVAATTTVGGVLTLIAPAQADAIGAMFPLKKQSADILTGWIRVVHNQVRLERFSPTSAARAYANVALAGYEAVVGGLPGYRSLGGQLNDFAPHNVRAGHNWPIALNEAVRVVAQAVFIDRSDASRQALEAHASSTAVETSVGVSAPVAARSAAYGRQIGETIAARASRDNYLATRGLAYTPPVGPDKWIRTPPNFGGSLEPHWGQVRSFTLTSNDECKPVPPPVYSEVIGSPFWEQAKATYDTVNTLDDARRGTALFWRDNPDGTSGLPSGHWMLTACQLIEQEGKTLGEAAEILVLTGLSLADGFTSCWTEKYQTNLLRPVTYIQRVIDPNWASFVNSPAFPEYTSGHSVGSAAAAETLMALFGPVGYVDNTGAANGYPAVRYASARQAADEAAISRLYGGIHYPMGIEAGLIQGAEVSAKVLSRARTRG